MQLALLFGLLAVFSLTTAENVNPRITRKALSISVRKAIQECSANLYQAQSLNEPGNLISSPLSTDIALAMLAFGSKNATKRELKNFLGILIGNLTKIEYRSVIDDLNGTKDVKIKVVSKIFVNKDKPVSPRYKKVTSSGFGTETTSIDCSKKKESANIINSFIKNETNHKITNVIREDAISPETQMILTSVVYFKGEWMHKFENIGTRSGIFVGENKRYDVQMMAMMKEFNYKKLDDLAAAYVELPYQGEKVSMAIFLPDEGTTLQHLENNLTTVNLQELRRSITKKSNINLRLPKFKVESTINMKNILVNMGLKSMFDSSADFSKISPNGNIHVSEFVQKAFIEVSEEGTEAAAVDTISLIPHMGGERPVKFHVNRPFHYKIIKHLDDYDSIVLFSGKVNNFEKE